MRRFLLSICALIFFLNACNINNSGEEVFRYSQEVSFILLNSANQHLIGLKEGQIHPDSVVVSIPEINYIIPDKFSSCGDSSEFVAPFIQTNSVPRPWDEIDTIVYHIDFKNNDVDTLEVYHYYHEPDDFYYKIFLYNKVAFDERLNIYDDKTDGCGKTPTYLIKETE